MNRFFRVLCFLAVVGLLATTPLWAEENRIWTGVSSQDFSDPANWDTGDPLGNRLCINVETGNYPVFDSSLAFQNPLQTWDIFLGTDGLGWFPAQTGNGRLDLVGGSTTELKYTLAVGYSGNTGTLLMDGASYLHKTDNGGDAVFGNGAGSVGNLIMQGGSWLQMDNNALVIGQSGGTGIWNMTGGNTNATLVALAIGNGATGTATIGTPGGTDNPAISTAQWFNLGVWGPAGTMDMYGASTLTVGGAGGWSSVGSFGKGTMRLHDSAQVTTNGWWINGSGGESTFEIHDNASMTVNGDFFNGGYAWGDIGPTPGIGHLTMTGGTLTVTGTYFGGIWGGTTDTTITNATLHTNGELRVGDSGTGTMVVNGTSTITVDAHFRVGYNGAMTNTNGDFTLNGGNMTVGGWVQVGNNDYGTDGTGAGGVVTVNGGTFTGGNAGYFLLGRGFNGTWNQVGGDTTINTLLAMGNRGYTGKLNLKGGTFTVNSLRFGWEDDGSAKGEIDFDGGLLKVGTLAGTNGLIADGGVFIDPYVSVTGKAIVKAGGAHIDTSGLNIVIGTPLLHDAALGTTLDGGLTVSGGGGVTLHGVSTYTGATTIPAGMKLTIDPAGSVATKALSMATGTTLNANQGQFTSVLNSASFADMTWNVGLTPTAGTVIDVRGTSGTLTLPTGAPKMTVNISALGRGFNANEYQLFRANSMTGGVAGMTINLDPTTRATYATGYPKNITTGVAVKINTNALDVTWANIAGGDWDATTGVTNWSITGSGSPGTASDYRNLDTVRFDNSTGINVACAINLVGTLHPMDIVVNPQYDVDYTFSGTGSIAGVGTTLTQDGPRTLTLSNTGANSFTGNVLITNTYGGGTGGVNATGKSALGVGNTVTVNSGQFLNVTGDFGGAGSTKNVAIADGSAVTVSGQAVIGQGIGGDATLNMTGFSDSVPSTMTAGAGTRWGWRGANATINLTNATYTTSAHLTVGDAEKMANSTTTLTMNHSTIEKVDGATYLGLRGNAVVDMSNGSRIHYPGDYTFVGYNDGYGGPDTFATTPTVTLHDTSAIYGETYDTTTSASVFGIGWNAGSAHGKVIMNDQSVIHASEVAAGNESGVGELIVNGGTVVAHAAQLWPPDTWYDSASVVVGRWAGSQGAVTVHGTAEVPAGLDVWGRINVGDANGAVGTLTVDGTGTITTQWGLMRNWGWVWGDGGWLTVGCSEWYEGGTAMNYEGTARVADATGGVGHVYLKDNSVVNLTGGGCQIGRFGGTGTLDMTQNAQLLLGAPLMVGSNHDYTGLGSTGTMTMTDDAKVIGTSEVYVGETLGHGELTMHLRASIDAHWTQVGRDGGVGVVKMYDDTTYTAHHEVRIGRAYTAGAGGDGKWYMYNNAKLTQVENDWFTVGVNGTGYLEANDNAQISSQWAIDIGDGGDPVCNGKVVLNGHSSMTVVADGLWIANSTNAVGQLDVNDFATVTLTASEIEVPWSGKGTLNIGDGNAAHNAVVTCPQVLLGWSAASISGVINLNAGGTLVTNHIYTDSAPLQSIINMNGGTLKATGNNAAFVANGGGALDYQFNVKAGGAKIDSAGFNVAISVPITGSATDGGLQKLGAGILTLTAPINVTGPSTVTGTLSIDNGSALNTMGTITGDGTLDIGNTTPGTELTADAINVDSLVIGAGTPVVYAAAATSVDHSGKFNHQSTSAPSWEATRTQVPGGVAPVPEPSTIVMLVLAGLGALLAWRRK